MRIFRGKDRDDSPCLTPDGRTAESESVPAWAPFPSIISPVILAVGFALCLLAGCFPPPAANDQGAHQSLVEIGERALETAEELENKDETAEANLYYRRALWAFRYHEQLTGEEPLLLEEALEGKKRTEKE